MTALRPGWRQDGWGSPKPRRTYRNADGQTWRVDQPATDFDRHVWSALVPLGFNPTPLHGSKR